MECDQNVTVDGAETLRPVEFRGGYIRICVHLSTEQARRRFLSLYGVALSIGPRVAGQ